MLALLALAFVTTTAVAQTTSVDQSFWAQALRAAPLPGRSQSVPTGARAITNFTGTVMVPPRSDELVGSLPITGAASWRRFPYDLDPPSSDQFPIPWYLVNLGREPLYGFPQAVLKGWTGAEVYAFQTDTMGCAFGEDPYYCASAGMGGEALPGDFELFFGRLPDGKPATVRHEPQPLGYPPMWTVFWYDQDLDAGYELTLTGCLMECSGAELAPLVGGSSLTPDNWGSAEYLMAKAGTFLPVRVR